MSEELFARKITEKDLISKSLKNIQRGLFLEALDDFYKVMEINFNYPLLYENISCVKFWVNRLNKINSLKYSHMDLANFLDASYLKFKDFLYKKRIEANLVSVVAIHSYIYNKIVDIMMYFDVGNKKDNKNVFVLLGKSFIELKRYTDALKTFDYLHNLLPYDGECLFYLSEVYYRLGRERTSKLYLRDALFYDVFSMPKGYMTTPWIEDIISIIKKRGIHNLNAESIMLWMSAYAELMNILDIKRVFREGEELKIRKMISKFEVDYRKTNMKESVSPQLMASYAWLMTSIIMNNDEEDAQEISVLGNKMAKIDETLIKYYIKLLDLKR